MSARASRNRTRCFRALPCVVAASLLLVFATGCGGAIHGHWMLTKSVPNKDVFAIDDAYFARDGGFVATVTIEGRTARERGTYEFNGFKLIMRPSAGGQRRYNAMVKPGHVLELLDGQRKAWLRRVDKRQREDES